MWAPSKGSKRILMVSFDMDMVSGEPMHISNSKIVIIFMIIIAPRYHIPSNKH